MDPDAQMALILQASLDQCIENVRMLRSTGPTSVDEIYGLLMATAPADADIRTATYMLAMAMERLAAADPLEV